MSARRRGALVWLLLVLGPLLPGIAPALADTTSNEEYKLKAALIYKLARFVEWPAASLQKRFRICVLGEDPFGPALDVLEKRTLYTLPIEVRRSTSLGEEIDDCGVLFITSGETRKMKSLLPGLKDRSVLTIGDAEDFAELGGMMQMSLIRKKIRFTVNLQSIEDAGLKVAAPLLELSTILRPGDTE